MEQAYGKLGSLTWIVGGDFNTAPDDPRFATKNHSALSRKDGFLWSWQGMPLARASLCRPTNVSPPPASTTFITAAQR